MSLTSARKVFDSYFGDWAHFTSKDNFRINDNVIYNRNTPIAIIYSPYDSVTYNKYLIVTLQNYKSHKSWRKDKKDLIKAGIDKGFKIIFVPELDIGFGLGITDNFDTGSALIEILKLYPYEHFKGKRQNVICLQSNNKCFTFDQWDAYEDEIISAEKLISDYIQDCEADTGYSIIDDFGLSSIINTKSEYNFYSLFELNADTLELLLSVGAHRLYYSIENIIDTNQYIQLTNDIWSKELRHKNTNRPITYMKFNHPVITKYKIKLLEREVK